MRRRGCAIVVLFLFAWLAGAVPLRAAVNGEWDGVAFEQASPDRLRCWLVLPARIVPGDADLPFAGRPAPFMLHGGRNATECVQLVILSPAEVKDLTVGFSDFKTHRATLAAKEWHGNKLGRVNAAIPAHASAPLKTWSNISPSAATSVPDPLLPDAKFDVDVGITRVWLSVKVPADAKPGDYQGTVRLLKPDGSTFVEVPLTLRVWDFTLSDDANLLVSADVQRNLFGGKEPTWNQLRPFYDDLKAHFVNATGEINPPPLWKHDEPPPDLGEYEKSLGYVLDELKFQRFRFPTGGSWREFGAFEPPAAVAASEGIWIDGSSPHANQGAATLARFSESADLPGEYSFETDNGDPLYLWLQVGAKKTAANNVEVDGSPVGQARFDKVICDGVRFASLPQPLNLPRGKHVVRITSGKRNATDPVIALFLTPVQEPDFEKILRDRASLSDSFKQQVGYHLQQTAGWLKMHGWLKKSQLRIDENLCSEDFGRLAALDDWIAQQLPTVRRESCGVPSFALRNEVEIWLPELGGPRFEPDEWAKVIQPNQELWASHARLATLGYPPIAMRMIPWLVARHGFQGFDLGIVNDPAHPLIYADPDTGRPMDSVRWEMFRQGMQDYQTLAMLRLAMDAATGRNEQGQDKLEAINRGQKLLEHAVPDLVHDARDFTWDAAALQAACDEAGEVLSILGTR